MARLSEGVAELSTAVATGEWDSARHRALKVRDCDILKQRPRRLPSD
jgi:hypothetical protein